MKNTKLPIADDTDQCNFMRDTTIPFLAGTFATAYKGSIASLIIQDLSMHKAKEGDYEITGKAISLPLDDFEVFLIDRGNIINRSHLASGTFKLILSSDIINQSGNLQLDIRQKGIHIGSFLLKKDVKSCSFMPALDIAEETHGFYLDTLVEAAGEAYGLVKKAKKIAVSILSPKRDCRALSEDIADFSRALLWHNRAGLIEVFPLLVHFSLRCATSSSKDDSYRTSNNLLSLMQNVIKFEKDDTVLEQLASIWMEGISKRKGIPYLIIKEYVEVLRSLHERLPAYDQYPLIKMICQGVVDDLNSLSFIPSSAVNHLKGYKRRTGTPPFDDSAFLHLTECWRDDTLQQFNTFCKGLRDKPSIPQFLEGFNRFDLVNLREEDLIEQFTEAIIKEIGFIESNFTHALIVEAVIIARGFSHKQALLLKRFIRSCFMRLLKAMEKEVCRRVLDAFVNNDELSGEVSIFINDDIGIEVGRTGDEALIDTYCKMILKGHLVLPRVRGFSSDTWEELVDPDHLKQVTTLMRIISSDVEAFQTLLRRLVCHIRFSGILIKDNAIFAREVTNFLKIVRPGELFVDVYLLLKGLPVYYREVGATGRLRDLTTELDAGGTDPLLYFLRKQSHCNAGSNLVNLVEKIFECWLERDPSIMEGLLPDEIFKHVNTINVDDYGNPLHQIFIEQGILGDNGIAFEKLRHLNITDLKNSLDRIIDINDNIKATITLLCEIYQLFCHKYLLGPNDRGVTKRDAVVAITGDIGPLITDIEEMIVKLERDKETFISPEETEVNESFYYKRHIAFGIPSIMGSYSEKKFDALGSFFRTESDLQVLLEELISACTRVAPNEEAAVRLVATLPLWKRLLDLHGTPNPVIDEIIEVSQTTGLYQSQISDLVRQLQIELSWIVERIQRNYRETFGNYLDMVAKEDLPTVYLSLGSDLDGFKERATDQYIRGVLTAITGLTELDRFLDAYSSLVIEAILRHGDQLVLPPSPQKIDMQKWPISLGALDSLTAIHLAPGIGTKAKNLFILKKKGGLVPEGIVFPTTAAKTNNLDPSIRRGMAKLEEKTGRVFGGQDKPLFVSVRSGSYVSMPGIMASLLYCGMNEETCLAFSEETGDKWLAYDSYRRFIEHYGSIVYGIDTALFKDCMDHAKAQYGYEKKIQFSYGEMAGLVMQYRDIIKDYGKVIPHDVYRQLKETVEAVFHSWSFPSAVRYREEMNISDHWGTAVLIMEMIPGNGVGSGTSVFFTRNPYTLERSIFGDTKRQASGEDLVYGKAASMPISQFQAIEGEANLEHDDPHLFDIHCSEARRIEEMMGGLPQEVEATYTTDAEGEIKLYILQTKRMEFRKGKIAKFKEACNSVTQVIGQGVGINGGALSGIAVLTTDLKQLEAFNRRFPDMSLILIRRETNTRDVGVMSHIDGLLTILGGATSHAAVQAQKFNLSCVVGCRHAWISEEEEEVTIGSEKIHEGDPISIDGASGLVYRGVCFEIHKKFV